MYDNRWFLDFKFQNDDLLTGAMSQASIYHYQYQNITSTIRSTLTSRPDILNQLMSIYHDHRMDRTMKKAQYETIINANIGRILVYSSDAFSVQS